LNRELSGNDLVIFLTVSSDSKVNVRVLPQQEATKAAKSFTKNPKNEYLKNPDETQDCESAETFID
jgi:hypothetical protein